MSTSVKTVPTTPALAPVASVIETDHLARHILRFLLENERAMDSAKGIAAWWVKTDELAVQPSLNRLFACGAITAHTLNSGTTLYGLSQDPDLRVWLRSALGIPERHPKRDDAPSPQR
jgi:hypothetical protein